MNYQIKEINDKDTWESFIKNHSNIDASRTSFIQSWNWGVFLEKQGQKTYYLGIYDQDKLVGVALGTKVNAKRGKYIHFRHGPVIDWKNKEIVKFVLSELKSLAKREKVWFIRISPLIKDSKLITRTTKTYKSQMHDVDAQTTWEMKLDKAEETMLKEMRKNTRYNIRKAEKMGIEILKTKDPKYLEDFWEIFQDTVKRQQWNAYSFEYIKDEFESFLEDDQTLLILAKYKGKFISASMFNFYNDQSVYHHSGNLTEYRKIPSSYLIQWEAIKEAKNRDMKYHNFWGVPLDENNELDQDHPWAGLGLFKVGFGGYGARWIHARDIPVSPLYWLTHLYEKLERMRRGYK